MAPTAPGPLPDDLRKAAFKLMLPYGSAKMLIKQLIQMRMQWDPSIVFDRTFVNQLHSVYGDLKSKLRDVDKTGANLTGTEVAIIESKIGADPSAIFAFLLPRLQQTNVNLDKVVDDELATMHMMRVGEQSIEQPQTSPREAPVE